MAAAELRYIQLGEMIVAALVKKAEPQDKVIPGHIRMLSCNRYCF
jgi:hypothetical protein